VQHGDILTAQAALQEIRGAPEHGTALLAQAWLFLEMGQPASAEAILSRLDERFPEVRRHDSAVLVSILSAAVLFRHCRFHRACRALTDALFAAGPEGLVRPFRTVGPRIAPLLALVLHKEKLSVAAHSLAHTLLQGFEHAGMLPPMPTPEGLRALVQAASISDREQEVLRRMEAGETNKDIARSLCITENTVKKHIRHIFEKLGMTNRMQAVARAKALNLV
jgi:LuxR family maltose regulon positive regulatory protein